jgi:hypothetical protein
MSGRTARIGALVAAPLAALALAAAAGAVGSYGDATGDGKGAPDISNVSVASDSTGQIIFTIHVDNLPAQGNVQTFIGLDTDMSSATGMPGAGGADYVIVDDRSDNTFGFGRWTVSDVDWDIPYSTVTIDNTPSTLVVSVNRSELGNTGEFNFWVYTRAGDLGSGQFDDAPDTGIWNYSLQAGGPDLRGLLVQPAPVSGPRAGKLFSVTLVGIRVATTVVPQPDSYNCRATLAGKPFAGTGTGGCTWKLPPKSRGKKLSLTVSASYEGATTSMPLTFVVA